LATDDGLDARSFAFAGTKKAGTKKQPTLLVVSGWQDVNIGDIAHTPGLLHVLETFMPEAKIILWKKSGENEQVNRMLHQNFPKVAIVYGDVGSDKTISSPEILKAFEEADVMVHGSGPSVVGADNLEAWYKQTGKPFGIFGTTIQTIGPQLKSLLLNASFIFTRETASIKALEKAGITGGHILFAPDATFYLNIRDDRRAAAFLKEKGLYPGRFICVIPRLRYTPYHKIRKIDWTEQKIRQVEETNENFKEPDHAKLREAMISWVRKTGNRVLVCPEMTYQVDIMDELLINPLPEDVKPFILKRGYWMPDEAASVYVQAFAVLSFECHSPIIALVNSIPAFYLRQPEDTIKGQMYYDLGATDWVFEIEQTTGEQLSDALMKIVDNPKKAFALVKAIQGNVKSRFEEAISVMKTQVLDNQRKNSSP
jgi:polysaccharide pyruvyl transferase WcaK-like protein